MDIFNKEFLIKKIFELRFSWHSFPRPRWQIVPTIQIKNHTRLRLAAVWPRDDLNLMLSASSSRQPPPVWAGRHGAQMQQPAPVEWIHCIALPFSCSFQTSLSICIISFTTAAKRCLWNMELSFLLWDAKIFQTKIEYCTICLQGASCLVGVTPRHGARQMNQLGGGGAAEQHRSFSWAGRSCACSCLRLRPESATKTVERQPPHCEHAPGPPPQQHYTLYLVPLTYLWFLL